MSGQPLCGPHNKDAQAAADAVYYRGAQADYLATVPIRNELDRMRQRAEAAEAGLSTIKEALACYKHWFGDDVPEWFARPEIQAWWKAQS